MDNKIIDLLKIAGEIGLKEQENLSSKRKTDNSLVTSGDLAISNYLEKELSILYPEFSIFSEENPLLPKKSKVITLDPIDGTESYFRKEDTWSILVGFLDEKELLAGFIYQPTLNKVYLGKKGEGSFELINNKKERLTAQGSGGLKSFTSHKDYGEEAILKNYPITDRLQMFSAALKFMEVAKGNADIYPNFRKACSLWDLTAPVLILEEAGGETFFDSPTNLNHYENPLISKNFCATGKRILENPFKK